MKGVEVKVWRCDSCFYFVPIREGQLGVCVRFPGGEAPDKPTILAHWRCGSFNSFGLVVFKSIWVVFLFYVALFLGKFL